MQQPLTDPGRVPATVVEPASGQLCPWSPVVWDMASTRIG